MREKIPTNVHYVRLGGSGGIRTHATEVTGALNQRLRPLGHAILSLFEKNVEAIAHVRESHFETYKVTSSLNLSSSPFWHIINISQCHISTYIDVIPCYTAQNRPLSEVGFEPTPPIGDQNTRTLKQRKLDLSLAP